MTANEYIKQASVGLLSPAGRFTAIPPVRLAGPPRQSWLGTLTARYAVWLETPSTEVGINPWIMFCYDRDSRRTKVLARSEDLPAGMRQPDVPGYSQPTVHGNTAFWATAYRQGFAATEDRPFGVEILSARLDEQSPAAPLVLDAKLPVATDNGLYYVRSQDIAPGFPKHRYEIHLRSYDDGADSIIAAGALPGDARVVTMAATGDTLAWIVSPANMYTGNGHLLVRTGSPTSITDVTLHANGLGSALELSVADGYVIWGNGSGERDTSQYAMNLTDWSIRRLGRQTGFSAVMAAGRLVMWARLDRTQRGEWLQATLP